MRKAEPWSRILMRMAIGLSITIPLVWIWTTFVLIPALERMSK